MKRILCIIMCFIFMFSAVACKKLPGDVLGEDTGEKTQETEKTEKNINHIALFTTCNCVLYFPKDINHISLSSSEKNGEEEIVEAEGIVYNIKRSYLRKDSKYSRSYIEYQAKDVGKNIYFEDGKYIGFENNGSHNNSADENRPNLSAEELKAKANDELSKYVDLSKLELENEEYNGSYHASYTRIINGIKTTECANIKLDSKGDVYSMIFHDKGLYTSEIIDKVKNVPKSQVVEELEENIKKICDESGITKYTYSVDDWSLSVYNNDIPMLLLDLTINGEEVTKDISLTHLLGFAYFYSDDLTFLR